MAREELVSSAVRPIFPFVAAEVSTNMANSRFHVCCFKPLDVAHTLTMYSPPGSLSSFLSGRETGRISTVEEPDTRRNRPCALTGG